MSFNFNGGAVKYFFLSDSWTTGRVWEFGGLWNEVARRARPYLEKQPLCIQENGETLCLYQTEDAVLMVEVVPKADSDSIIGQVVLKRLLTAEQLIERLCQEETVFHFNSASRASVSRASASEASASVASSPEASSPEALTDSSLADSSSSENVSPESTAPISESLNQDLLSR
jgi:hypothetical protein